MVVEELLNSRKYIFYDGAMGTMLLAHGLKPGADPMLMNMTSPETVERVHRMYIEAGSDIICANTFGANALNLRGTGYSPAKVIAAAIGAARRAAGDKLVALDVGPTGHILEPAGELSFDSAYEMFKEMAVAGERAGADLAAVETFSDPEELTAAMTAIKDNTELAVFATMTFEKSGYTFMGCTPEKFVETAENLGAAAIGLNCSLAPEQMRDIVGRIAAAAKLPLIVKPNAGLPDSESGEYTIGAAEFARQMAEYKQLGVKVVGGCCGTTPGHIKALKEAFPKGD